jgi:hypothetical protein
MPIYNCVFSGGSPKQDLSLEVSTLVCATYAEFLPLKKRLSAADMLKISRYGYAFGWIFSRGVRYPISKDTCGT